METPAIDALLTRVATFGLHDDADITIELGDDDWRTFIRLVRTHRLSGLLSRTIRAGSPTLDEARRLEVDELYRQMTARVLLLETMLVSFAGRLAVDGIPYRVLKGPAAAALYPDRDWRPYVDIDVLVPGQRFADAARILEREGYRRRNAGLGEAFDRRFGKGATFRQETTGVSVDLHRTLVAGPYGFLVDPADLFAGSADLDVGGTVLAALDLETRFVHACISTVLSDATPKLITVRDVAQQLRTPELDPARVDVLCERWRIGSVVEAAVRVAEAALTIHNDRVRLTAVDKSPLVERVAAWGYTGDRHRWRRQALTAAPFVPGWLDRLTYLRAVIGSRGLGDV